MKKISINMCDIGFGANSIGIQHGYKTLSFVYPELAKQINYIPFDLFVENMKEANKKFYNTIYNACESVYQKQLNDHKNGMLPILIGGDHSLALGSVKASIEAYKNEDIGLVWIDAHTDINTFETTISGNIHGMPVAGLLSINDNKYNNLGNSYYLKPENIAFFATRSIDKKEMEIVKDLSILNIMYQDIAESSLEKQVSLMINHLKDKVSKIHISFDLDSLDPSIFKGVSTPVKDGLTGKQPIYIINELAKHFEIVSFDIVEYNPLNDIDYQTLYYIKELLTYIKKCNF